ncbi:MAG: hypothetical protein ACYTHN_04785 [Planctomycetota bacterium]|jgi:hypothetical protein
MRRLLPIVLIILLTGVSASAADWTKDPVPALAPDEVISLAEGISDAKCDEVIEGYVHRIEETYASRHKPPEGFIAWIRENPDLRKAFWLALSPDHDNIPAAMSILDDLRQRDAEKVAEFAHLSVALAVVWDTPRAIDISQRICIFAVKKAQFPKPIGYNKVFQYFTDSGRVKRFLFKPSKLVWPILVYVANFDVSEEEAAWALEKYESQKKSVGSTYAMVQYDTGKRDTSGRTTKLGDNPYTLPNLLKYGGVCGDQAHFCSRVAKCLGIPAMKASGLSRYGGAGHAFTCFFILKKNRPVLESTGRYYHDFYYTGNIFDPQTCQRVLERTVAMMLDGASLSYGKFILSQALTRIAYKIRSEYPPVALVLLKKAITSNYFCAPAWRLLMEFVKEGKVKPKEGLDWANIMLKYLPAHPDLTYECFGTFLGCIPHEEYKKRQSFYNRVAKVYEERPDLLLFLKESQGKECIDAGKEGDAVGVYISTCAENAKEGRLIMPLLKPAVEILNRNPKMLRRALPYLEKVAKKFPKRRGGSIAKAFQDVARLLIPLFEEAGDKKMASRLRREAGV